MGRRGKASRKTTLKERLWKIAIYIRLSKEDGNDESKSVEHQRQMILDYLKGFDEPYEIVDIYIDDGCTGTDTDRDGFQRMLSAIKTFKVNCVIVKDLSRLSRNLADSTFHIENTFVEFDIRFISLELPSLDSYKYPEAMNSIAVSMQNVINDDFCRQTSIKVRGVFNNKRRNGKFIGAFAPYGYAKDANDKSAFVIDEEAAVVIRDIFHWYVKEGVSKGGIARRLNEMGILNPAAYKKSKGLKYQSPATAKNDNLWSLSTISVILQNQMYVGDMVQGKYRIKSYKVHTQITTPKEEWIIVENTHDAIVDRALFEKAQELQQRDTRTAPTSKAVHVLSGFVRCADCGKAMVRTKSGGTKGHAYHKCRTHREKGTQFCTAHTIRSEILEQVVYEAVKAQISLVGVMKQAVDEINKKAAVRCESHRLRHQQEKMEQDLERVTSIKDGLFMDWKNGDITREEYRQYKAKQEAEIERLQEIISHLIDEQNLMSEGITSDNLFIKTFSHYAKGFKKLERDVVVDLIDTINVHEGGMVDVQFTFADQHQLIIEFIENNSTPVEMELVVGVKAV